MDPTGFDDTVVSTSAPDSDPDWSGGVPHGTSIGNWIVERIAGFGGFASVYRSRHRDSGVAGALKLLHPGLATYDNARQRFAQEIETIRRLTHPSIVQLLDFGEARRGLPYIVLEWLEGRTLEHELRARGTLSLAETLSLMTEVCDALAAAHALGVVHRDLKPSNIMIVPQGESYTAKIVDFGIAKILDESGNGKGLTATGMCVGTPNYMAPEQVLGQGVDPRTDIYALGVMLFELLTGKTPFEGGTAIEIEELHLHAPVPRASERAPIPNDLDLVIRRCLEKSRDKRFSSVTELAAALRNAIQSARARRTPMPTPAQAVQTAIGFGVSVRLLPAAGLGELDDDELDKHDAELDRWREGLTSMGFVTVVDQELTLLAVSLLADRANAPRRAAVVGRILDLAAKGGSNALSIALHVGPVTFVYDSGGRPHYIGGALLDDRSWTAALAGGGVAGTTEAIEGLERIIAHAIDDSSKRMRLSRR